MVVLKNKGQAGHPGSRLPHRSRPTVASGEVKVEQANIIRLSIIGLQALQARRRSRWLEPDDRHRFPVALPSSVAVLTRWAKSPRMIDDLDVNPEEFTEEQNNNRQTASEVVSILALTGLRTSECRGLRWADWDEERMVLNVRRSVWETVVGHQEHSIQRFNSHYPVVEDGAGRRTQVKGNLKTISSLVSDGAHRSTSRIFGTGLSSQHWKRRC